MSELVLEKILSDDFTSLASPESLNYLRKKTILITGATGTVGRYLLGFFLFLNKYFDVDISLICVGRDEDRLRRIYSHWNLKPDAFTFVEGDLAQREFQFGRAVRKAELIFHLASYGSPEKFIDPLATALPNIFGTTGLLSTMQSGALLFYASSTGVYGDNSGEYPFAESGPFGGLDCQHPIGCYLESKRCAEMLIAAWQTTKDLDFRIGRLSICFGPGIQRGDGRFFADLCFSVADGNDFIMKSNGAAVRNFTYMRDCLSAIMAIIMRGEPAGIYNIASPSGCKIKDLAINVTSKYGLKVVSNESDKRGNVPRFEVCDSGVTVDKLMDLGWKRDFCNEEAFYRTISYIRACKVLET